MPVSLSSSAAGISYQLWNGTTALTVLAGGGSAVDFGMQTNAGAYTVTAENDVTHCSSVMTGTVNVVVNPVPVVYTVTGGGSYCAGSGGLHVGLSSSATGIDYRLFEGASPVGSAMPGTGAAIDFGLKTNAAIYTVVATNPLSLCNSNMTGSAVIAVNPVPVVYNVIGGGSYCAGGSGVHIGLSSSASAISYRLWSATTGAGSPVAGTGGALDFGFTTSAGTYKVIASNPSTGCLDTMNGTATVTITPVPVPSVALSATPGNNVCAGTAVHFSATPTNGGTAPVYQWRINGTIAGSGSAYSYTPANADNVSVKLMSSAVCASPDTAIRSLAMTVNSNQTPTASITINPSTTVCEGKPVTFSVTSNFGGSAPTYVWMKNGTAVSSGATYSTTAVNGNNIQAMLTSNYLCRTATNVLSNSIAVVTDAPLSPVVTISSKPLGTVHAGKPDTLTASVTGGGSSLSYQWMVNGTIVAGATTNRYISSAFANGDLVECSVMTSNDCGQVTRGGQTIISVGSVGINLVKESGVFAVTPNPNKGEFTITGTLQTAMNEVVAIEITDMLGQVIFKGSTQTNAGKLNQQVTLGNNVANGVYLLSLHTSGGNKMFRIVVEQ